jgi:hypothetical protein
MPRHAAVLAIVAALAGTSLPARADDLATVRDKVAAAMTAAKSFVFTMSPASGISVTTTFVAPDRYHAVLAFSGSSRDVVVIGTVAYVSADGAPYRKLDTPPDVLATQAQLRNVPVDQVLPDKPSNGVTYGQFATSSAGPQKDQHFTCTYDKKTSRIVACENEGLTLSFSRFDDPANIVTIPTRLATPAPAPSATPGH